MGSTFAEKTEDDLRKEIDELQRQQREITERLRDPRGLRRGRLPGGAAPRNFPTNGARQRGFTRPVEDGEITEDAIAKEDVNEDDSAKEATAGNSQQSGWSRRDGNQRHLRKDFDIPSNEHVPRVLPKNDDPSLVSRNKRMLGQLLGTLEKFRKEDKQLSGTEAFMRRSNSLQRAEQRAREESERLRQQEREKIAENRRRDLTLRARVSAKTEEKKLELLFLRWSEHHRKLCNFIRTKAEPPIYYLPKKPLDVDATVIEQQKEQAFEEWKASRREEVTEYQKQIGEQYLANVEKELERWQNARNRKANNDTLNLQETMDKELDTHRLEHGPKKRTIPSGSNNEEEDDVEDINGEDDMMDDVLDVDDSSRRGDETARTDATIDVSPNADKTE
ncbi:Pinin/SDK/MemA protein [Trema orientale]|uniref:Pinin/SDK/MemA protein n=1 Tax=Trema orientale TaxID=63057 RepID=A0A2P5EE99_TREOI|nr:Pinin/SDK/MemA protein [Trema orientale]